MQHYVVFEYYIDRILSNRMKGFGSLCFIVSAIAVGSAIEFLKKFNAMVHHARYKQSILSSLALFFMLRA